MLSPLQTTCSTSRPNYLLECTIPTAAPSIDGCAPPLRRGLLRWCALDWRLTKLIIIRNKNIYDTLSIRLITYDAVGVSTRDETLAAVIDSILSRVCFVREVIFNRAMPCTARRLRPFTIIDCFEVWRPVLQPNEAASDHRVNFARTTSSGLKIPGNLRGVRA